jgi:hypothetical protein
MSNVAQNLRPGGLFIATIPDADELRRRRDALGNTFGNKYYNVKFATPTEYTFTLTGAVEECPEYLVEKSALQVLGLEVGLVLETYHTFAEYAKKYMPEFQSLLERMRVLPLSAEEEEVASLYAVVVMRKK